jgi:hypothetical protein
MLEKSRFFARMNQRIGNLGIADHSHPIWLSILNDRHPISGIGIFTKKLASSNIRANFQEKVDRKISNH